MVGRHGPVSLPPQIMLTDHRPSQMPLAERVRGSQCHTGEREEILHHPVPARQPPHTVRENGHEQIQGSHLSGDILKDLLLTQNVQIQRVPITQCVPSTQTPPTSNRLGSYL